MGRLPVLPAAPGAGQVDLLLPARRLPNRERDDQGAGGALLGDHRRGQVRLDLDAGEVIVISYFTK